MGNARARTTIVLVENLLVLAPVHDAVVSHGVPVRGTTDGTGQYLHTLRVQYSSTWQ